MNLPWLLITDRPSRLPEAKAAYQRVLEIDYRNVEALSFMGVTLHLLGDVEAAIVKYHEVRHFRYPRPALIC